MAALAGYRHHCRGYLAVDLAHDGTLRRALGFSADDTCVRPALPYNGVLLRTRLIEPCLPVVCREAAERSRLAARDQARRLPDDGTVRIRTVAPGN
jgi:hypothetical protein